MVHPGVGPGAADEVDPAAETPEVVVATTAVSPVTCLVTAQRSASLALSTPQLAAVSRATTAGRRDTCPATARIESLVDVVRMTGSATIAVALDICLETVLRAGPAGIMEVESVTSVEGLITFSVIAQRTVVEGAETQDLVAITATKSATFREIVPQRLSRRRTHA